MKVYDQLDDRIIKFIEKQKMFFVASAPLSADGHINLSPKGYDAFKVLDDTTVAWLDLGGSGIETQAHVQENGRITIMFCAFEGPANILRLFGTGEIINPHHAEWDEMMSLFPGFERARGVFKVKLTRIQDSCGWACRSMSSKASAINSRAMSTIRPRKSGSRADTRRTLKALMVSKASFGSTANDLY